MRVLIAGATGVIGFRVARLLVQGGHAVAGLARREASVATLRAAGVTALPADALDAAAVQAAFEAFRPEAVVHELTALAGVTDLRRFEAAFAETDRLRSEGSEHLLLAALGVGARRFVSQSFCGWPYARVGGPVKSEDDPLDPEPAPQLRRTLATLQAMERRVTGATPLEGVVLRYGTFNGPGTNFAADGSFVDDVRRRRVPLVGDAGGVFSFIHVDDAAAATVAAVEGRATGIFNVVDDEPAPVREWLPLLAAAVGAAPPWRVPAWLMRLVLPAHLYDLMTSVRGGSNARIKAAFGWAPRWATWRDGFRALSPG